jgi:hypothetical protein
MSTPTPGIYRKGLEVRTAETASEAVALKFAGFVKQTAAALDDVDYRDLQQQAKDLGIPANQAKTALAQAIADHVPSSDEVPHASDVPAPDLSYVSGLGDGHEQAFGDGSEFEVLDDEAASEPTA